MTGVPAAQILAEETAQARTLRLLKETSDDLEIRKIEGKDLEGIVQAKIDIENEITNNESFALASPLSDDLIDFKGSSKVAGKKTGKDKKPTFTEYRRRIYNRYIDQRRQIEQESDLETESSINTYTDFGSEERNKEASNG